MKSILDNYSNNQLEQIKHAAYKIADAYQIMKALNEEMENNKQWVGQGDIARIVHVIDEQLVGSEGCLNSLLKAL